MHTYVPKGVCARLIDVELDGDTVRHVAFTGGCDGNLKAISRLVEGQNVDQVIETLKGNRCGRKPTSCADQLAVALEEAKATEIGA